MRIRCPKQIKCDSYHCARDESLPKDVPVHEPCKWYMNYRKRIIRKEKLEKINGNK